jgi:hypothetical protein
MISYYTILLTSFFIFVGHVSSVTIQGSTTRYWDCCKPLCAWNNKELVSRPVETCDKNGARITKPGYANVVSGCDG